MFRTAGETARAQIRKRGLIYFEDVLDEMRSMPNAIVRTVIALSAAHCLLRKEIAENRKDPLLAECLAMIELMWRIVGDPRNGGATERLRVWLNALPAKAGKDLDRDAVAATLYAGKAVADGDAASAGWAVARLVDDCFARVGGNRESSQQYADDSVTDCAAPRVQTLLNQIRTAIEVLEKKGVSANTLETIKNTFEPV
jgi:hypothetical protein